MTAETILGKIDQAAQSNIVALHTRYVNNTILSPEELKRALLWILSSSLNQSIEASFSTLSTVYSLLLRGC